MSKTEDTRYDEEAGSLYFGDKAISINDHLQNVIATHFDPETGSNFWLKHEKKLNLDARKDITDFEDLKAHLGLKGGRLQEFEDAMRYLPIRDLVPKSQHEKILRVGETGGTTGVAKKAAFSRESQNTLVSFCNYAFELHGIPVDRDILYIGPPPPHTFGFVPMDLAKIWNKLVFSIDLDTRIIKKFIAEGRNECLERYMRHIIEQSLPLLKSQDIGVLITTSKILEVLPRHLDMEDLDIKGIIHAGTPLDPDTYKVFKEEVYVDKEGRSIPLMGLYGNGHSGALVENPPSRGIYNISYYPPHPLIVTEVVEFDSGEVVDYGGRGQVVWHRLTSEFLIPGMPERDEATRIMPAKPFEWDGIQDVDALRSEKESLIEGVY